MRFKMPMLRQWSTWSWEIRTASTALCIPAMQGQPLLDLAAADPGVEQQLDAICLDVDAVAVAAGLEGDDLHGSIVPQGQGTGENALGLGINLWIIARPRPRNIQHPRLRFRQPCLDQQHGLIGIVLVKVNMQARLPMFSGHAFRVFGAAEECPVTEDQRGIRILHVQFRPHIHVVGVRLLHVGVLIGQNVAVFVFPSSGQMPADGDAEFQGNVQCRPVNPRLAARMILCGNMDSPCRMDQVPVLASCSLNHAANTSWTSWARFANSRWSPSNSRYVPRLPSLLCRLECQGRRHSLVGVALQSQDRKPGVGGMRIGP